MQPESALLEELVQRILAVSQPVKIILFGSAARAEMTPGSDLDVLVVVTDGSDRKAVSKQIYHNLIGFGAAADIVIATEADLRNYGDRYSLVYYPALREGRELYAA